MLAYKVEVEPAVGVRPQPALGPVEPGAVVVAAGQVPKRHRDLMERSVVIQAVDSKRQNGCLTQRVNHDTNLVGYIPACPRSSASSWGPLCPGPPPANTDRGRHPAKQMVPSGKP